MGLKWLVFLIEPLVLIGMWFGEDQEQTLKWHMFKRNWTTSSNINNNSTLNSKHNCEDLCIQLNNQQTTIVRTDS